MAARRVRSARLRIELLLSEFDEKELAAAIRSMDEADRNTLIRLVAPLPERERGRPSKRTPTKRTSTERASQQTARPLPQETEEATLPPILLEFANDLANKRALASMTDLRSFAAQLGLDVSPKSARRSLVPQVVQALAGMPPDTAIEFIQSLVPTSSKSGAYGRLANFLISGIEQPPKVAEDRGRSK